MTINDGSKTETERRLVGRLGWIADLRPIIRRLAGRDLLGWGVKTQVWLNLANALSPVSKAYGTLPGLLSLLATYLFLLWQPPLALGSETPLARFAAGFTAIFGISYACGIAGSYAYIAATPDPWGVLASPGR